MIEILRRKRNLDQLALMHPQVVVYFAAMLRDLEAAGWRPRLQETFRSPAEQEAKWRAGLSRIRAAGPHTCTTPVARPASLATHFLDDSDPLTAGPHWWAMLAVTARHYGLQTGLAFGLEQGVHRQKIEAAVQGGLMGVLTVLVTHERGFDPLHVEKIDWKGFMP